MNYLKKNQPDESCFDFVIESDHIHIKYLSKCCNIKGDYFLDKISKLATLLKQIKKVIITYLEKIEK